MKTQLRKLWMLLLLMAPLGIMAQTSLQSGDRKTGRLTSSNQEAWYTITVTQDGEASLTVTPLQNANLRQLHLYAVSGGENKELTWIWVDGGNGGTLTRSNLAPGTYRVLLQGYPKSNEADATYQISYTFTAPSHPTEAEPNNTWQTAVQLEDGKTLFAHLGYDFWESADIEDWYKIDVPADGTLTIELRSYGKLKVGYARLFTVTNNEPRERNAQWMDVIDETVTWNINNVSAGSYYLNLPRYNEYGLYQVTYYFTTHSGEADPEPNDTWQQAVELKAGPAVTGQLGYDYQNTMDKEDWYKFDVPEEGTITLTTRTEGDFEVGLGYLYAFADGELKGRNSRWLDISDSTLVWNITNCAAGTYYLCLPRYSSQGTYSLQYTFTPCPYANDPEPNDAYAQAGELKDGVQVEGRLGYDYWNSMDAEDWYKFDVPEEGTITLTTRTKGDFKVGLGYLYAFADGELKGRNSRWLDISDSTLVWNITNCAAGTYYLCLPRYSNHGGYTLKYDFTPCPYAADPEPNSDYTQASELMNGVTVQGRLGYDYWNSMDAEDWYKFEVPADGTVTLTTRTEGDFKVGLGYLYAFADGELKGRNSRWLDISDSTLVWDITDCAAGTYYLSLPHYADHGGYTLKYDFTKNPYYRQPMDNGTFAKRYKLEEGKAVYSTLGYSYWDDRNWEDWYDLGMMHGRQIDVTVEPDTSRQLNIGYRALYKYVGDNEDGTPQLQEVAGGWQERTAATLSYIDNGTEDSHYVFKLPIHGGGMDTGGYKIVFGDEIVEGDSLSLAGTSPIKVMTGGRSSVRKGVPCENPITITNFSDQPTGFFILAVEPTEDVNIIGFRMPVGSSSIYLPVDSVAIPGDPMCVFFVPNLNPWESYTFTMISEGVGDIAYAPGRYEVQEANGQRRIVILGTTVAVTAIAFAKTAAISLAVGATVDWASKKIGDAIFPADSDDAKEYANLMGQTTQQLGIRSSWDSPTVYTAKSVIGTAAGEAVKKGIGASAKTGTVLDVVGNVITAMQNIIPNLRRRIWHWIYKDLGYFDNPTVVDGKKAINDVVSSWDPNEMVGPQGEGEEHYISGEAQTMQYTILFENKAEAGDAAYRIRVSDELDENVFDVSSVKFGATSHDGVGYNWKMSREGNKLSWDIEGIELPPNVNAPEGEGYVTFSVDLKPGLADGTQIKNKATIIFDKNFPIETNEYVNTVDITAPVTTMSSAGIDRELGCISVFCESTDTGSGVGSYQLFVSKDGGDYEFEGKFFNTAIYPVTAGDGSTYSFYVLATDLVGNTEVVIPTAVSFDNTTGIRILRADDPSLSQKIYTLDGKYVGDSTNGIAPGIYIRGGKKLVVK